MYSVNWPNFSVWLPLLCKILVNMCIAIVAVSSIQPKSQDKNLNILRTKRLFKMKWKAFFIPFKWLSLNQRKWFFLLGDNPTLIITVQSSYWLKILGSCFLKSLLLVKYKGRLEMEDCTKHHRTCSIRKSVLRNLANFTGKHLCWSLFLTMFRPKGSNTGCFFVKFEKFFRKRILRNICERLLLSRFQFIKNHGDISANYFYFNTNSKLHQLWND